nr:uncharacterized protein LOC109155304 [Ipomoea batatas]
MEFDANWGLNEQNEPLESYQQMVFDAAGPNLITRNVGEEPNVEDKRFFDMLDAADRELWSGCEKLTQLSAVARLLNIKTKYRLPEQCFDAFCQLFKDGLPEDNNMEGQLGHYPSYYELFKHTHTKQHDGQTFIVEKAKQIHEQVESQRELLTQNGEQVDDNQLYYDAVGGHDKKRRIYGLGSYGCSVVNGQSSDNTSCNMTPTSQPPNNATSTNVQDEIQSLKATILVMQQRLDAIDGGRAGTSSSPPSQTN